MARKPSQRDYRDLRNADGNKPRDDRKDVTGARDWWNRTGPDCAGIVRSTIETLFDAQAERRNQRIRNARLYGNLRRKINPSSPFARNNPASPANIERLTYNGIQENVDTIHARVGETTPRPYFLTNGGTYKQKRKAEKLNQFVDGTFYETKAYDIGLEAFRDGEIQGDGFSHAFGRGGKLHKERVSGGELWVDEMEAQYGFPRNLHRVKIVDREELATYWPKSRDAIMKAGRAALSGGVDSQSDMVTVAESWHLAALDVDGKMKGGKRAVCLVDGNHMLVEPEDWPYDFFPFARFSWCKRPDAEGYWSQSLTEQLQPSQYELNKNLWLIQKSMGLMGSFKLLLHNGSKVVTEHLSNEVGAIVKWAGNVVPQYVTPDPLALVYFQNAERLIERMRDLSGVSKMQTTGTKPPGELSGKALRTLEDVSSDRHRAIQRAYDAFYMQMAALDICLANEMAEAGDFKPVRVPGKASFRLIDWKKDIGSVQSDEFVMRCFPVSALTGTPEENLQTIQEYVQAGFMSPREARRALDFPDLQSVESLANAQEDIIDKTLGAMVDDGVYAPPEPTDDLQMAKEMCLEYIQKYRCLGLEEEKLDMLRTYNSQIDAMTAKAAEIQASQQIAVQGAGAPQAVPAAPPVSQLLPNAPTASGATA